MSSIMSFLIPPKSYGLCCISSLSSVQNRSLSYFSSSSPASSSSLLWKTKALLNPTKPSSLLPVRFAASSSKKVGADENLKRVFDSEIKCAENSDDLDQGLLDLSPFEIVDYNFITLKREFAGESIKVHIDIDQGSPVSLIVDIDKGSPLSMRIWCTASRAEIVIHSMSICNMEDIVCYEVLKFSNLDENLQRAFYQYLEVRGITNPLANSLQEYIVKCITDST